MAVDHPDWVRATIRALAQAEVNGAEIHRRLTRGQIPGHEPYQIPKRTVQQYAQRARQQLEPIGDDDIATANAIERAVLRITRAEVHRLELKQKKKQGLTTGEAQALRSHAATVDAIRTNRRRQERPPGPAPDPQAQERGQVGNDAKRAHPATLLDRIAADLERNGDADKPSAN